MQLVYVENNRPVTDSLIVAETFEKSHDKVLRDIRELGCSHGFRLANFGESSYINAQNREMPRIVMTEQGFTLLAMGYTGVRAMEFKERYISEFHRMRSELERRQTQPTSIEDLIIMQAQSVKELKNEVSRLKEQSEVVNHRINLMDRTDIVGDEQQRFNKMIRKFAWKTGIRFDQAYRDFKGAFNISYRTNITAVHENYMARYGKCTLPEFLVATGRIEDALRVVDKMLNQEDMSYG